jgi:sugar phosphate isomerase/epimerase
MLIGVRAHDYGRNTPKELVSKLQKDGFEAVQLAIHKAILGVEQFEQITDELLVMIREDFKEGGIAIPVLGCYVEPSLLDKEKRLLEVERFYKGLAYSKVIGARLVGTETTTFVYPEDMRKAAFEGFMDSILRMVERAEKLDATVAIEPVHTHTLNTPELTFKMLQSIKSDKLKIIFDPVNMLSVDRVEDQKLLWKECFEAFGESIETLHIRDMVVENNEKKLVPLGTGIVDHAYLFEWLHQHKPHIAILKEGFDPQTGHLDIAFLNKIIRNLAC